MQLTSKIRLIAMACVLAIAALSVATGCASPAAQKDLAGTHWHFESIAPSEASMADMDDKAKADAAAQAEMLKVFYADSEAEFKDEGKFSFKFLGDNYEGTWEKDKDSVHVVMGPDSYCSSGGIYKLEESKADDGKTAFKLHFTADAGQGRLEGYDVVFAETVDETAK